MTGQLRLDVAEELRFFLPARRRGERPLLLPYDGTSTLGHVVGSTGIPLTEVGPLTDGGEPVGPGHLPRPGARIGVGPVPRPQPMPEGAPDPPRFLLDVHLGALARRLRLVGADTAWHRDAGGAGDAGDAALVAEANAGRRVLLTRDRGLLHRRALRFGAHVRAHLPDDQLTEVLTRFDVPLAPFTRCPACNGLLEPVAKADVAHLLPAGTRRTYDTFTRCRSCARLYWPGAHHARLVARVAAARATVARRGAGPGAEEPSPARLPEAPG